MGTAIDPSRGGPRWRHHVDDPQVQVGLVAAACLIIEAVVAKNVIDAELGVLTQLAPLWVFITYQVSGLRDHRSEIAFMAALVAVTAAVLVLYAV
jgi:hypothetical protein